MWLQEHAPPTADVTQVSLSRADGIDASNRFARNRLWMNPGFTFAEDDPIEGMSAHLGKPPASGHLAREQSGGRSC